MFLAHDTPSFRSTRALSGTSNWQRHTSPPKTFPLQSLSHARPRHHHVSRRTNPLARTLIPRREPRDPAFSRLSASASPSATDMQPLTRLEVFPAHLRRAHRVRNRSRLPIPAVLRTAFAYETALHNRHGQQYTATNSNPVIPFGRPKTTKTNHFDDTHRTNGKRKRLPAKRNLRLASAQPKAKSQKPSANSQVLRRFPAPQLLHASLRVRPSPAFRHSVAEGLPSSKHRAGSMLVNYG